MLYADGNNVDEKDKLITWGERAELLECVPEKVVEGLTRAGSGDGLSN